MEQLSHEDGGMCLRVYKKEEKIQFTLQTNAAGNHLFLAPVAIGSLKPKLVPLQIQHFSPLPSAFGRCRLVLQFLWARP